VSRDLGVYLTVRRAMFMRGETEAMVPLTMEPKIWLDHAFLFGGFGAGKIVQGKGRGSCEMDLTAGCAEREVACGVDESACGDAGDLAQSVVQFLRPRLPPSSPLILRSHANPCKSPIATLDQIPTTERKEKITYHS